MPTGIFDSSDKFTPAVSATGSDGAAGIVAGSDSGTGVVGYSSTGSGVGGISDSDTGVTAQSKTGIGLHAVSGGVWTTPGFPVAIFAEGGPNMAAAVYGKSSGPLGTIGIWGASESGAGVHGGNPFGTGVSGEGGQFGVVGRSQNGIAVQGIGGYRAGRFFGDVEVQGMLTKSGGFFKIDHPLDPENKYLSHSFVESPDMLNIYNGNITTNTDGNATIILPDYFEALNRDFRYQLTVIGQFAQAIVTEEVRNNQFTVKTDQPNIRVSWQVTGVRKDHFANMHRIPIEEDKPADERGMYLHPEAHGKPETQSIKSAHEKRLKETDLSAYDRPPRLVQPG